MNIMNKDTKQINEAYNSILTEGGQFLMTLSFENIKKAGEIRVVELMVLDYDKKESSEVCLTNLTDKEITRAVILQGDYSKVVSISKTTKPPSKAFLTAKEL